MVNFLKILAITITASTASTAKKPFIENEQYISCEPYFEADPLSYCEKITVLNPLYKDVTVTLLCNKDEFVVAVPSRTRMQAIAELQIPSSLNPCVLKGWK